MIKKYFNYSDTKYKKLVPLEIAAITLFGISLVLIVLFIIFNKEDQELMSFLPALLIFLMIIPIAFFFASRIQKKYHMLDTWLIDNNDNIYYINVTGKTYEFRTLKRKLSDSSFLEMILRSNKYNNAYQIWKINRINSLEEKTNYLKISINFTNLYTNRNTDKIIWIMKSLNNYEEFITYLNKRVIYF